MASMFVFKKCFYHRILIWITFFFLLLQLVHIDRKMRAPFAWNNKNKKNLWIQLVDCCQSSSSNVFLSLYISLFSIFIMILNNRKKNSVFFFVVPAMMWNLILLKKFIYHRFIFGFSMMNPDMWIIVLFSIGSFNHFTHHIFMFIFRSIL